MVQLDPFRNSTQLQGLQSAQGANRLHRQEEMGATTAATGQFALPRLQPTFGTQATQGLQATNGGDQLDQFKSMLAQKPHNLNQPALPYFSGGKVNFSA